MIRRFKVEQKYFTNQELASAYASGLSDAQSPARPPVKVREVVVLRPRQIGGYGCDISPVLAEALMVLINTGYKATALALLREHQGNSSYGGGDTDHAITLMHDQLMEEDA